MPILKPEPDVHPPHLFASAPPPSPWWVAHSRSRQEKLVARHLLEQDVPYYLPQYEKRVRRNGRERVSYLPLFPGYVFFAGDGDARRVALQTNLLVSVLTVDDQAALRDELARLWQLQSTGVPLVPHPYIGAGDEVEVVSGPLRGCIGTVSREKGSLRLVVDITFLRRAVAAELSRDDVVPVPESRRTRATPRR